MIHKLIVHTTATGAALSITGLSAILLMPIILAHVGSVGFGLLVLLRLSLPSGIISIFDFGISEIATQVTSKSRTGKSWIEAAATLISLHIIVFLMSVSLGLCIFFLRTGIADMLAVPSQHYQQFLFCLVISSFASPILFTSLVSEGVMKGFEKFVLLRFLEIITQLLLAVSYLLIIFLDGTFSQLFLSLTMLMSLKAISIIVWSSNKLSRVISKKQPLIELRFIKDRAFSLWCFRIIDGLQSQSPSLLIGVSLGPTAVAVYEAVIRLPAYMRFFFETLAMTIIPTATRLSTENSLLKLQKLGQFSLSWLPIIMLAPLIPTAVLSDEILRYWLGEEFSHYGFLMASMAVVTLTSAILHFQHCLLISDRIYQNQRNKLKILQLSIQLTLSFALFGSHQIGAFVFGYSAAAILMVFPFAYLFVKRTELDFRHAIFFATAISACSVFVGALTIFLERVVLQPFFLLVFCWMFVCGTLGAVVFRLLLRSEFAKYFLPIIGIVGKTNKTEPTGNVS